MARSTRSAASARRATWARLLDPAGWGAGGVDAFEAARRFVAARAGADRDQRLTRLNALGVAATELGDAALVALCWGCEDDEVRFVAAAASEDLPTDPTPAEVAGWLFADGSRGLRLDSLVLIGAASHDLGALCAAAALDALPLGALPDALEARRDPFAGADLLAEQLLDDACASWRDASAARAAGAPDRDMERLAARLAEACASLTRRWSAHMRRCAPELAEVVGSLDGWSTAAHFYALAAGPAHRAELRRSAHQDTNTVLSLLDEHGCDDVAGLFELVAADERFADQMIAAVPQLGHRSHLAATTMCYLGAYALWRRGYRSAFVLAALDLVVPPADSVPSELLAPLVASMALADRTQLLSVLCSDARAAGLRRPPGLIDHDGIARELGALLARRVLSLAAPLPGVSLDELRDELTFLAGRPVAALGEHVAPSPVEQLADATWTSVCLHLGLFDLADDEPHPQGSPPGEQLFSEPVPHTAALARRLPDRPDRDGWARAVAALDPSTLTGPEWDELFAAVAGHAPDWGDDTLVAAAVAVSHPSAPRVPAGGVAAAAVFSAAGDDVAARAAAAATLDAAHTRQHVALAEALATHVDLTGLHVPPRPAAPDPSSGEPDVGELGPVRVLWLGGNETQAGYRPALLAELEDRYSGRVSVEFVFPGWSSNWSRVAGQVERRLTSGDLHAVVCHYFVRTGLGRAARRTASAASVPWVSAKGHGRDAMLDAIVAAVDLVDSSVAASTT